MSLPAQLTVGADTRIWKITGIFASAAPTVTGFIVYKLSAYCSSPISQLSRVPETCFALFCYWYIAHSYDDWIFETLVTDTCYPSHMSIFKST